MQIAQEPPTCPLCPPFSIMLSISSGVNSRVLHQNSGVLHREMRAREKFAFTHLAHIGELNKLTNAPDICTNLALSGHHLLVSMRCDSD